MIILKRDVTDPKEAPLLLFANWQTNPDGTMSLLMPDGTFAYQQPNQYGVFGFSPVPAGAYQQARINGQLVAFWTRPQDPPFVYAWVELPN
ncbi:MAG TPA: hypothetical protein VKR23_15990 [Gaiellaceae bacterium]|nr:hypothetical protein [Gaiellaceae bacterium]